MTWARLAACHSITRSMCPAQLLKVTEVCVVRDILPGPSVNVGHSMEARVHHLGDFSIAVAAYCVANPGVIDLLPHLQARRIRGVLWPHSPGVVGAAALERENRELTVCFLRYFVAWETAAVVAEGPPKLSLTERLALDCHGHTGKALVAAGAAVRD